MPVINLKNLNSFMPYQHHHQPHLLKRLLQEWDFINKIYLKNAYFTISIVKEHMKYLGFRWEENLFKFLFVLFVLGPASLLFTKLIKSPIVLLQQIKIHLINDLDDMLIMTRLVQNLNFQQHTVIYLLQNLGFVMNLKKSFLESAQKMEFLEIVTDSVKMQIHCLRKSL